MKTCAFCGTSNSNINHICKNCKRSFYDASVINPSQSSKCFTKSQIDDAINIDNRCMLFWCIIGFIVGAATAGISVIVTVPIAFFFGGYRAAEKIRKKYGHQMLNIMYKDNSQKKNTQPVNNDESKKGTESFKHEREHIVSSSQGAKGNVVKSIAGGNHATAQTNNRIDKQSKDGNKNKVDVQLKDTFAFIFTPHPNGPYHNFSDYLEDVLPFWVKEYKEKNDSRSCKMIGLVMSWIGCVLAKHGIDGSYFINQGTPFLVKAVQLGDENRDSIYEKLSYFNLIAGNKKEATKWLDLYVEALIKSHVHPIPTIYSRMDDAVFIAYLIDVYYSAAMGRTRGLRSVHSIDSCVYAVIEEAKKILEFQNRQLQ